MATERDFELLDDYLTNRLSGNEKSTFEQKLESDPELQNEKMMQERLIKSIRNARVAELKAILNNVPIPPVSHGGTSVVAKYAAGTIVAGMVATGLYFYFNKPEETQAPIENVIASDETSNGSTDRNTATPTDSNGASADHNEMPANAGTDTNQMENSASISTPANEPSSSPSVTPYNPASEDGENSDIEDAAGERSTAIKSGAPLSVEINQTSKEYKFNYQWKDGKVILYGPFQRNLYEVLEFFKGETRTVYLYYKDKYYLLSDTDSNVHEPQLVNDLGLIKSLQEYRQKK
jgi:hypothetical protein